MSASRQKLAQRRARKMCVRAALHPSFTGELFDIWRRARELWLQFFHRHDTTLVALAERQFAFRAEHQKMSDWIHHLEQLVRGLILTAAFALKAVLTPRTPKPRRRKHRIAIVWDNKPDRWVRLTLRIFPHTTRAAGSYGAPAQKPSRFARTLPLARLQVKNRTSNTPRTVTMDAAPARQRALSRGRQATESALEKLLPLCEDRMDAWVRRAEPG